MGFARQGMALARWLPTVGARVTVTDLRREEVFGGSLAPYREAGVAFVLGEHPLSLLDDADLLCVSGGVPLTAPLIEEAGRRAIPVRNDAQLFLERCPAPVIGITGSAGKTTTTTLVGQMCRADGRVTHVGGNIGDVLLDALPQITPLDMVVMELSSFQLELVAISPRYAAILNVTPNHLDRHGTMEAYTAAKARLIRFQQPDDVAVLGLDDPGSASLAALAGGRVVGFSARQVLRDGAFLDGDQITLAGRAALNEEAVAVIRREAIPLRGFHNVLNVLAACAISGAAGVDAAAMRQAITAFQGVPHRQEVVRAVGGVTWVNDSIATAPERVLAAVRSYDESLVLLLGGRDKNLPWDDLVALAIDKARAIVTFGEHGPVIADRFVAALAGGSARYLSSAAVRVAASLEEAVSEAADLARPGDVVLLSPGCTSYDAYLDFEARGAHFRELVAAL